MVSVIIPVYNVERYIERCICSALKQSYSDLDIIVVDDGSLDKSREICEELCKVDNRIRLVRKQNGGAASARNVGLEMAKGDWVIGLDADDWIEKDYIMRLVHTAEENNLDCCISSSKLIVYGENDEILSQESRKIFDKEFITGKVEEIYKVQANACAARVNDLPINIDFVALRSCATPWDKLYKNSIIQKANLRYDEDLHSKEDIVFSVNYLKQCNRIGYIDTEGYRYGVYKNSLSHGYNEWIVSDAKLTIEYFNNYLKKCRNQMEHDILCQGMYTAMIRFFIEECERYFFNKKNNSEIKDVERKIVQIVTSTDYKNLYLNIKEKNLSSYERKMLELMKQKNINGMRKLTNEKNK